MEYLQNWWWDYDHSRRIFSIIDQTVGNDKFFRSAHFIHFTRTRSRFYPKKSEFANQDFSLT